MSAISSPSQSVSSGGGNSASEIDASCRAPILLLFISALVWLLIGSLFGMMATLKFHAPKLLANCAWLTYGRVHPANLNALVYGFAVPAGLGVILWMMAHLGRTRLAFGPAVLIGAKLWNLGVTVGIIGILYGENTGFEWLEMPRYASMFLLFGYLLIGLAAMRTINERTVRALYIPQWFALAALFWFPWIYSTANMLLVVKPVRGALQTVIDHWYANNLTTIWFGFVGLAAIFYFIPKIVKRQLYSHYLGIFIFWTLAFFGSSGAIPAATPLPSWIAALSTMCVMVTLIPIIGVFINVRGTLAGNRAQPQQDRTLKFFVFGAFAYVLAGLAAVAASTMHVNQVTNFTWFIPAQTQMFLYGFFAITTFGAIYHIVPRLVGAEFLSQGMICTQFLLSAVGILAYALPLAIGGILQGLALNDASRSFPDVMLSTLTFLRVSTLGDVLMLLGHIVILLNVTMLLVRVGRTVAKTSWDESVKAVEVRF